MPIIHLKSPSEIEAMFRVNQVVAEALQAMAEAAAPGVSTALMDEIGRKVLEKNNAKGAFLGYPNPNGGKAFPATVCASLNEVVVHGIPRRDVILKEGDILSLDFGAVKDGWVGDSSVTVPIGKVSGAALRLMDVTRSCLYAGIEAARVGNRIGDISHAVQRLAEKNGYGVVHELVGHGIGRRMHEPPPVPNVGKPGTGERLREGMTIAIEPMINEGTADVETLKDDWTVVTKDRKLSAHFEHSIAITADGARILSAWQGV